MGITHIHMQASALPEAYNEILSERVNFPLDREQTQGGRELKRERERASEQGGEGVICCDISSM